MAIDYTVTEINPEGLDRYSTKDTDQTSLFGINSSVDLIKDKIETHFLDLDGNLIDSIYNSVNIQTNQDSEIITDGKPSTLKLNPQEDVIDNGFGNSSVKVVYNFLSNLYSETKLGGKFFIETISEDRTELRLLSTEVSSIDIESYTDTIVKDLESTSYFNDFRLNFRNNQLLIGLNIKIEDYREYKAVIVKLYEPLPEELEEKTILTIDKKVADSVAYEISAKFTPEEIKIPYLKGPNFIVTEEDSASPTSYLNYQELFDFPTNNSYRELNSLFSEKGISLSIEYSDFSNFIHFSSVEERLKNFQYKLNLIEEYQVSASSAAVARASGSVTFTSGSDIFWKEKLDGIINNFDHYDRHLYYSSGSTSWPKQSPQEKPYIQATGSATGSFVDEYFGTTVSSASNYDTSNPNILINTVPEYIRDDVDSAKYSTFIHMLAQHFDNLYIYSKALSDKYDNDNRLDFGASKDLIQDLLKNFGVKIYNNVRSADSLFDIYSGQTYQTGSDTITSLISASNTPVSTEDYRNEIHKRVYHNLPYLLKTKGTERGLKALIASFGIPTDNNIIGSGSNINGLYVRTYGGGAYTGSFNSGPLTDFTSSLGKIRIDNTGSIVAGDTLSQFASIVTRDKKYSDDIHSIEVGFSPTYELNDKIVSASATSFNIDNLIGDPGNAFSSSYQSLDSQSLATIGSILTSDQKSHNYGELVRYLKYYDNVLFKMIKDFVPARANVDTGLIIKPHILERNKIKQVQVSGHQKPNSGSVIQLNQFIGDLTLTGSIDTAFSTGSDASAFTNKTHNELNIPLTASYSESIVTPIGLVPYHYHEKERTRYDGEFSGSQEIVYQHTLNDDNDWKYTSPTNIFYKPYPVNKLGCPTISISLFTTSSSSEFIYSGSFEAPAAGTYTVYIEHNSSSTQGGPESAGSPRVISSEGTVTWDYKTTTEYAVGEWHPTASIDFSGSDCGLVKGYGSPLTITAPAEVCPTLSTVGFEAQTGFSGSDYNSALPLGYSNPTGLKLHMTGAVNQLPDGDPIDELGFVIGTSTDPTISGSGVLFQGVVALNGGGAAGTVGDYFNNTTAATSTWIQPNTTYYMRAFASASSTCGDYVYGDTLNTTTGASTYIPSQSFDYGSAAQSTVCNNFHLDSGNNQGYFWTYDGTTFGVPFAIATHLYTAPIADAAYAAPSYWYVSGSRQGSADIREVGSGGALNTNNNCPYTP